jgi:pilus assembly protein Flp/PilA
MATDLRWDRAPRDERGASSVEYALLAVLIAVVVIAAVMLLGSKTRGMFDTACESLPSYDAGSAC